MHGDKGDGDEGVMNIYLKKKSRQKSFNMSALRDAVCLHCICFVLALFWLDAYDTKRILNKEVKAF